MTTLEFYIGYYGRILWKANAWVTECQFENVESFLDCITDIGYDSELKEAMLKDVIFPLGPQVPFDCWEDWAEFLERLDFETDLISTKAYIATELQRLAQRLADDSLSVQVCTFLVYLKQYLADSLELLGKEIWVNAGTGEVSSWQG